MFRCVAIYVNKCLTYNVSEKMSYTIDNVMECITVEISLHRNKKVIISCMYMQPGANIDTATSAIEKMYRHKRSNIYLCGDFNVNLLNYDNYKGTMDFLNALFSLGLYPCIDKPTRITQSSSSLIDNIFTNALHVEVKSGILINDISDHLPVFTISNYSVHRSKKTPIIYIRKNDDESILRFSQSLMQESWEDVYSAIDVHKAYERFIDIFNFYHYRRSK